MSTAFSNDATAAHLAISAVAPLVLFECCPGAAVAVLVWLAVIAAIWSVMAPVKRGGEASSGAHSRLMASLLADTVSWMLVLLLGYSSIVALNGGVGLVYDYDRASWMLAGPSVALLPGGVAGSGGCAFAATLLAFVIGPTVVHSLDVRRAVDFAIFSALLVSAWVVFACCCLHGAVGAHSIACGLWSMVALGALCSGECTTSRTKEVLSVAGFIGCLSALLLTRRPVAIVFFAGALCVQALLGVSSFLIRREWFRSVRVLVMFVAAVAAAVGVYQYYSGDWSELQLVLSAGSDATLHDFAISAWESNPWSGAGVGAFPLSAKLAATSADWSVLGPLPDFYRNWWTASLAERGMIGAVILAVAVFVLAFSWFRSIRARGWGNLTVSVALLPLAALAVVAVLVFDGSAAQADALVAFAALAAVSINGGT